MRRAIYLLAFLIMLSAASASIQTGSLSPQQTDLCGGYSNYVTLTAGGIRNLQNMTLTQVKARLHIRGSSGLSFITSQEVTLGDIAPLSLAGVEPRWTVQCGQPAEGAFSAYINYTSSNGIRATSIGSAEALLVVHRADPLEVNVSVIQGTPTSPEVGLPSIISDNTPTISVNTNRDSVCKGSVDMDEIYENMDFIFFGTQRQHDYTFQTILSEGIHIVYVKCKDNSQAAMPISTEIRFIVDTTKPRITVVKPLGTISQDFIDLNITVSEESSCRYSDRDEKLSEMTSFNKAGKTSFSSVLTDLDLGDQAIYFRCKDIVGNEELLKHEFGIELPPSAVVTLSKKGPLKAGTYEVTLLPSKKLRTNPVLTYSFTDSPTSSRFVSLEKAGANLYSGYMIIDEYDKDRVGSFTFQGFDINGVKGTDITEGGTFLVDTKKPEPIKSIEATADVLGDITIRWFYDEEAVSGYNIYRSVSPGVDYIHSFATTKESIYVDDDMQENVKYYYKVAPVDEAGNIGALSKEVSATSTKKAALQQPSSQAQQSSDTPKPSTLSRYNETLKLIERLKIDLDYAESTLKERRKEEAIVDTLNLVKDVQDAILGIDKLKKQLLGINPASETDRGLTDVLNKAETLISTTEKITPQDIEVSKKSSFVQSLSEQDVLIAVKEMLKASNYTEKEKEKFTKHLLRIHERIKVEAEVETLQVEFLSGDVEKKVFIRKKVSYESPESLLNVQLVEVIPKTVAGSMDSIDVLTPDYAVINPDPVISWRQDSLTYDKRSLEYMILSSDSSESLKGAKTVVMTDPLEYMKPKSNAITGFVASVVSDTSLGGPELLGLAIGMFTIIGLLSYYLIAIKEVPISLPFNMQIPEALKRALSPSASHERAAPSPVQRNSTAMPEKRGAVVADFMIPPQKYFYLANGDVIRSLGEFRSMVRGMDYSTFAHHVRQERNDFAEWIRGVYGYHELAERIQFSRSREEIAEAISRYVQ